MRNRSLVKTALAGLVFALVLFSHSAPGLAQSRLAVMPGDSQVMLAWNPVDGATSYNVYMANETGVGPATTNLPGFMAHTGASSPFTHTGLTNGTKYFFVVTAVTTAGEKRIAPEMASVPSANVAAAIQGLYAFFDQLKTVINAHNPPAKDPSDLSYTHLAPLFDSAFLSEGRDAVYEAKRMANEMRDSAAIESLVIDHVNFYDETNQVISVGGTVTIGGMTEFVNGHEDGLLILKRQADNATWLAYGDQRIVKGQFQVEMRTDRMQGFSAGPRQHVNFDIEAPIGTITSASITGPGLASPLQLQFGQVRVETIVGDPAQQPEIFERDAFFGGFDPGAVVQAGTMFTLSVTKTGGESVSYPLVFRGIAVTDPVAGAITITNLTGHALADAHLGNPLSVQWTLPTAYPIVEVRLDGWTGNQDFNCYVDNHDLMLPPNATSGTITLPTHCNGQPVTYAGVTASASGENGRRSAFMHGFSNPPPGGGTTGPLNIPNATIPVDGAFSDWGTVGPLATDPQNDSSPDFGGDEIIALYAARDLQNLYLRMDLWENLNPNFGNGPAPNQGSYRFLIENNGSFPQLKFGVAYGVYSDRPYFGQWSVGYNGSNEAAPASLVGPSFVVAANGGRLDLRIPLGLIGNPTVINGIRVEVSDCCDPAHAPMIMDAIQAGTITFGGSTSTTTTIPGSTTTTIPGSTTTTIPGSTTTTTTGGTSTTTTTASTTTTTLAGGGQVTLEFGAGWNLVGNSADASLDVATAFGDTAKVTTVWKWVADTARWAFYAPSLVGQALADYATSKGYDVLSTIAGGEGFWVNAKGSFTAALAAGTAVNSAGFQDPLVGTGKLVKGWNLIAIGDNKSPSEFNKALSVEPPAPGEIPLNLTTLWAWDSAQSNWYFYAPSLEKNGTLSSYIASKSYLDFDIRKLDPATGFWVNKP